MEAEVAVLNREDAKKNGIPLLENSSINHVFNLYQERFHNAVVPDSPSEWHQLFETARVKSAKRIYSYEEHMWTWTLLIKLVHHFDQCKRELMECYCSAISCLPIKAIEPDNNWVVLINSIYSLIINGEVTRQAASVALEMGEKKFKNSPKNAKLYWQNVFRSEKLLMKQEETSIKDQQLRFALLWKTRFSNPYVGIEDDYSEFSQWASNAKLDKDIVRDVKETFLTLSKSRRIGMLTTVYSLLLEKAAEKKVLQVLEEWVVSLIDDPDDPNFDFIEVVFEELIAQEPNSIAYYWIFLHTLSSSRFDDVTVRAEKIMDIIIRAFKCLNEKGDYDEAGQIFLEMSLAVASKCLDVERVKELLEIALGNSHFALPVSPNKWYARSRGVLIAVSNLIHAGKFDHTDLERYFERVILPCNLDFYKCSTVPQELDGMTGYETFYVELVKLFISCQKSIGDHSWNFMAKYWTEMFFNNSNPIMCTGYAELIKTHCKPSEALEAIDFAIRQVKSAESNEMPPKLSTKRCFVKLLQYQLEVYSASGNASEQINTAKMLQKILTDYSVQFPYGFEDLTTPGTTSGFYPYGSYGPNGVKIEKIMNNLENENAAAIAKQLESLRVTSVNDQNVTSREQENADPEHCKIFVSNLNYNMNEEHLMEIFQELGYPPKKVQLKRTSDGLSRGKAVLTFKDKEQADCFFLNFNGSELMGRKVFLSRYGNTKPLSQKTSKPTSNSKPATVLSIFNLPQEWNDQLKIRNMLSQFGHIKEVEIDDLDPTSLIAKITFYMPEDAQIVKDKVTEEKIFGTTVCRLGYESKKKPKTNKKEKADKNDVHMKMDNHADDNLGVSSNLERKSVQSHLIPSQVAKATPRTRLNPRSSSINKPSTSTEMNVSPRKRRPTLEITGQDPTSDSVTSTKLRKTEMEDVNQSEKSTSPSHPAEEPRIRILKRGDAKSLTNSDFKKLFEK